MSILKDLYNGKIFAAEITPTDPDYRILCQSIDESKRYFKKNLSLEDKIKFDEMDDLMKQTNEMNAYTQFSYGFRLGALLITELFKDEIE